MATLGDLKQRVITETLRDDLADDMAASLDLLIQKSIEHYAAVRWWFNERRILLTTSPGVDNVPWPADDVNSLRVIDGLYLELSGGNRWPISPRSIIEWEALSQPGAMTGQPLHYLVANDVIKLWPVPSTNWTLALDGLFDVTPLLKADTDSNFWTNQGSDLIVAQVKIRLYRDFLSATVQDSRLVNAITQEDAAYSRLRSESSRRTATGRVKASW